MNNSIKEELAPTASLSNKLRELRFHSKLPLELKDIAEKIGINYQTFYKYYNNKAECSIGNLCKIAKYYNVSTDWLLGISKNKDVESEEKSIYEFTTLNDNAIKNLQLIKEQTQYDELGHTNTSSVLIESNHFFELIKLLNSYSKYSFSIYFLNAIYYDLCKMILDNSISSDVKKSIIYKIDADLLFNEKKRFISDQLIILIDTLDAIHYNNKREDYSFVNDYIEYKVFDLINILNTYKCSFECKLSNVINDYKQIFTNEITFNSLSISICDNNIEFFQNEYYIQDDKDKEEINIFQKYKNLFLNNEKKKVFSTKNPNTPKIDFEKYIEIEELLTKTIESYKENND